MSSMLTLRAQLCRSSTLETFSHPDGMCFDQHEQEVQGFRGRISAVLRQMDRICNPFETLKLVEIVKASVEVWFFSFFSPCRYIIYDGNSVSLVLCFFSTQLYLLRCPTGYHQALHGIVKTE